MSFRPRSWANRLLLEARGSNSKVLAKYAIPLGANEATLEFTGESTLSPSDFDDLKAYIDLFKKQWERKAKTSTPKAEDEDEIPDSVILKHAPKP